MLENFSPIKIKIKPPGPKARAFLKRDGRYISPSSARAYPLVVRRAQGTMVEDVDGNRYLDFTSGVAVTNTGHCHPEVVKAISEQAGELLHMSGADFFNPLQIELAERLDKLCPGPSPKRVFFSNSGAEAVEAAIKLVRYHTGRPYIIAFIGGFHGRTMGALSLTASKPIHKKGFFPLIPGVIHVPYAYCYRCPYGVAHPAEELACVKFIEEELFKSYVPPEEVAAVFVEPIQGEGGYIVPPKAFLKDLSALCKKYGILLVADEVQSGMGRTGKMLAIEHFGVEPDVICLAKGIASGLPLGATIARQEIMGWPPGTHASTFGGNPVSCRAALVTLELLRGGLINNATELGDYLLKGLKGLSSSHPIIGEVRGKGLMIGIELVGNRDTKERAVEERDKLVQRAFEKGLLLLGCGRNSIRFVPPLTITRKEADTALSILEEVLREVER
jgi:4-aminobutyrate aminotransferase